MPDTLHPLFRLLSEHLLPLTLLAALIDATGVPFPGRLLLVVAGAMAGPSGEVAGVVACAAAGALVGDHFLYLLGVWTGDRALAFYCRVIRRVRREACGPDLRRRLRQASMPALILGRFTFAVRIVATTMAGMGVIPYWRFLLAEVVGTGIWASGFVLLGWTLGPPAATFLQRHGLLVGALMLLTVVAGVKLALRDAASGGRTPVGARPVSRPGARPG